MASSPTTSQPQSPPRKRARLSLKLMRKEQQPTVPEESEETIDDKPSCPDTLNDTQPLLPDPSDVQQSSSSCIPSEYVISVAPYTGLHNLGNTCYLNSVLQVLRYCPGFVDNLDRLSHMVSTMLKVKEEEDAEEVGQEDERRKRRRKEVISQLRLVHKLNKLFKMMAEKEESYVARMMPSGQELAMYPEEILDAIRELNPMFKGYLQHDAQELLCCILSNVQEACQAMCAQQEPGGGDNKGALTYTSDPSTSGTETSDQSMKAARRLDMGGAGDGGSTEDMDCGKLLGGGRSRNTRSFPHAKLVDEGHVDGGLVKHKEMNGDTKKHKGTVGDLKKQKDTEGGSVNQKGSHSGSRHKDEESTMGLANGHMNGDHSDGMCNGIDSKRKKASRIVAGSHGGISPSNDSVRRRGARKSNVTTNGHLSNKEINGLEQEHCLLKDDAGDGGSSKKRRLGMGRFVTFQQTSILSKFGIVKKERSHSSDDQEQKDTCDINIEDHKDDNVHPDDNEDAVPTKCRNITSNNSNSPNQSLNMTCESIQPDSDNLETIKEEQGEKNNKEKDLAELLRIGKEGANDTEMDTDNADKHDSDKNHSPETVISDKTENAVQEKSDDTMQKKLRENAVEVVSSSVLDLKLVEKMFQGTLALRTRCLECESCSEKREDFQDVSVPVQSIPVSAEGVDEEEPKPDVNPRNLSLGWALSEFTSVERLTDENKYSCEHCFRKTEAERSVLFGRLPGILIIQLKRFSAFINSFSPGGSVSKVNDHLAVPLTLNLERWCSPSCGEKDRTFELSAVVAHSGSSSSSGHYMAYTKVPDRKPASNNEALTSGQEEQCSSEIWANFDDDRVQLMSEEDFDSFLNPLPGSDTAATPYLLLYRQVPSESAT